MKCLFTIDKKQEWTVWISERFWTHNKSETKKFTEKIIRGVKVRVTVVVLRLLIVVYYLYATVKFSRKIESKGGGRGLIKGI